MQLARLFAAFPACKLRLAFSGCLNMEQRQLANISPTMRKC
ncbi:hypothetical protein [Kingella oralis]|jgi:hypothetical protein|nr:hypothetical protein [Kingella oralis]